MHGPPECLGNIILLCAAHLYPEPKLHLGFANCTHTAAQQWHLRTAGGGVNLLANSSTQCLDIYGGGSAPGTPLGVYGCNGHPWQVWHLTNLFPKL